MANEPSRFEWALRANGGLVLIVLGLLLVAAALATEAPEAVATVLALVGAGSMVLGVLLPRVEGQVELGPGGLKVVLAAVDRRSAELGLSTEERAAAIEEVARRYRRITALTAKTPTPAPKRSQRAAGDFSSGDPAQSAAEAFAEDVIDDVISLDPIEPTEVPPQALDAIREATGATASPDLTFAARRPGRGAPRWLLVTQQGERWRVSNTRHGWNVRKID